MVIRGRCRGISVMEFLIATLMASIGLTGLVGAVATQARSYRRIEQHTAAHQTVRLVIEVVSRDLRRAGFDPTGQSVEAIPRAGDDALEIQADDDGDGRIDDRGEERVAYRFHPGTGTLSRLVGRQSMPLANGLAPDGFRLWFLDDQGSLLNEGGGGLDDAQREAIRAVHVGVAVRDERGMLLVEAKTGVMLRNPPWSP